MCVCQAHQTNLADCSLVVGHVASPTQWTLLLCLPPVVNNPRSRDHSTQYSQLRFTYRWVCGWLHRWRKDCAHHTTLCGHQLGSCHMPAGSSLSRNTQPMKTCTFDPLTLLTCAAISAFGPSSKSRRANEPAVLKFFS